MPNLTKKELRKAAIEAAKCSGFMMEFKKRVRERAKFFRGDPVVEEDLDELFLIAYDLLK